jgi:tyrosyl-tRNA synthetase
VHLPTFLVDVLGVASTSEARRLVEQRAVRIDDELLIELDVPRARLAGALVQAGKRRYVRVAPG